MASGSSHGLSSMTTASLISTALSSFAGVSAGSLGLSLTVGGGVEEATGGGVDEATGGCVALTVGSGVCLTVGL